MVRTVVEVFRPLVVAALAVAAAHFGQGCYSQTPTPKDSYHMQQQACVLSAQTLEESRACRARVDAAWGVKRDAGE